SFKVSRKRRKPCARRREADTRSFASCISIQRSCHGLLALPLDGRGDLSPRPGRRQHPPSRWMRGVDVVVSDVASSTHDNRTANGRAAQKLAADSQPLDQRLVAPRVDTGEIIEQLATL